MGKCVQIVKKDEYEDGKLQFGTEVVRSKDGSVTCLLGASPGASTVTQIMLEVFEIAFPEVVNSEKGKTLLKENVPIWKQDLDENRFVADLQRSKKALQR